MLVYSMDTKSVGIGIICLTILSLLFSVALYPALPDLVASHWDRFGHPNSFLPKFWALFMFPFILSCTFLIWLIIPVLEPLKKNFETFRNMYNGFWLVVAVFVFYIFTLTVGLHTGWEFNFNQALAPAIALLFAAIAVLLERTKRNYFVGIRTPWTLSSDKVWKRTHLLGSSLFYFCAVWAFAGTVYPEYLCWYIFVPLVCTVLITTVYSYIEFRRQEV